MANEETIATGMAGRYASALFDLAKEQTSLDRVAEDLNGFVKLIGESDDLKRLVRSPAFTVEDQVRALGAVLDRAGVSDLTARFLKLVAQKRRLFAIESMVKDFNALNDRDRGVTRARVTVAEPLSTEQWSDLQQALTTISGSKSVAMDVFIDPEILGGMTVKIGSRMVDSSLRTKLNSLRTRMKEVG
ncbi:F0F1 ATP synthase subunit delta [Lichenihabitans sp. Uapishka_5]|uniref:F0F1 ATP synthase subunit delta n=1 Tax=Lichenihabitans sp. Uapishka_5 TaxID=3037302 RepID=UPI0029E80FEF|nr:F0F1 ATP synthase subunit delta [Lichenihabitans sp. Uapishka_5]MDX7952045.1 F0F1 ATP synthase subunit delta [Lichenihabitans sp. Uapishka_5]